MIKHLLAALLVINLIACGGSSNPSDTPCPTTATTKDATVDAGAPAPTADAAPCSPPPPPSCDGTLRIDLVEPSAFPAAQASATMITLHGCGFSKAVDVQVSVMSTRFSVVDDTTLVFTVPTLDASIATPYRAEVDVIHTSADQVQTFITYQ